MDLTHLQENYSTLLEGMKQNQYGDQTLYFVRKALDFLMDNLINDWKDFAEAYFAFIKEAGYPTKNATCKAAFATIDEFDRLGIIPNHDRGDRNLFKKRPYDQLNEEFKALVDFNREQGIKNGKKAATLRGEKACLVSFFLEMIKREKTGLKEITEQDVLSYYLDENEKLKKSPGTLNTIKRSLEQSIDFNKQECSRLLPFFPKVKKRQKNQPKLNKEETKKLKAVISDMTNNLSYRDRGLMAVMVYAGCRVSDVADLLRSSLRFDENKLSIVQRKTTKPVTIPMHKNLKKALQNYLENERPDMDDPHVFLTKGRSPHPISTSVVEHTIDKVYKVAEIRMNGKRRGGHIIRRAFGTTMLEKGVSRPVVSELLGHTTPDALESYLCADFEHLKECALSIEEFPVDESVFEV